VRRSGRSMNRKDRDRRAEMRLTKRTRKLIPETRKYFRPYETDRLAHFATYRRRDDVESDGVGKRRGVDGRKDEVLADDRRLVDGDSGARRSGHVRTHRAVADELVDQTRQIS